MLQESFTNQLTQLGRRILPKDAKLWLYGSRARHDARPDSDWDLLILLNKDKQENADFDKYSYPLIYLGAEAHNIVSAHLYTQKEWESMSFTPFYKNVEHDKIELI
ncbi:MAG: nucleotidyltransferase domain-containing protein [Paludibacteraceae bacterium]|nr:nucleotidyltransferase domain-containing protein [Paludibacteraceae bacterium]